MEESEAGQLEKPLLEKALRSHRGRVGFERLVPNPKLKPLDRMREVMRLQVDDGLELFMCPEGKR
jgi:hypothetical protein